MFLCIFFQYVNERLLDMSTISESPAGHPQNQILKNLKRHLN